MLAIDTSTVERQRATRAGLPPATIDAGFLKNARDDLQRPLDEQTSYLASDAQRMHHLEHRLYKFGRALFALTALVCIALLMVKLIAAMVPYIDGTGIRSRSSRRQLERRCRRSARHFTLSRCKATSLASPGETMHLVII